MGGTLERRVDHLERRARDRENSEFCDCPGPGSVTVDWGDGDEPEAAAICPRCGRPIRTVTVTWDDLPGEIWD